jgi:hypothetical protein
MGKEAQQRRIQTFPHKGGGGQFFFKEKSKDTEA